MHMFWYDYVKLKYIERAKPYYMDSFIVYIKTEDIYKNIANNVETRFYTSNYEFKRSLSNGRNRKVIRMIKDDLVGKLLTEFYTLGSKT